MPEDKKEAASAPINVAFADLSKFMAEPRPSKDKWCTFIDGTKGNVSTFFKYQGHLAYAYSEDDMKDDKLNKLMKSVVTKGLRLYFDFMDTKVEFEKSIHPGALPVELFSPGKIHSEEMSKRYQEPDEDLPVNDKGSLGFIFTSDKDLPKWVKENTTLVYVNP